MLQVARWRIIMVAVVCLLGLYFALPSLAPAVRGALPGAVAPKPISLGLDLQGGSELLFEIDQAALRLSELENFGKTADAELKGADPPISSRRARVDANGQLVRITLGNPELTDRAVRGLRSIARDQSGLERYTITGAGGVIEARLTEEGFRARLREAVEESREVIRRRIDPTGTREVTIVRQGSDVEPRINVQAPGVSDPAELKGLIGQTAVLSFHLVPQDQANCVVGQTNRVSFGAEQRETIDLAGRQEDEPCLRVFAQPDVEGDMLTRAVAGFDPQTREPIVSFGLNPEGTRLFRALSTQHTRERFAIVLDGGVITAPVMREPILGGSGQISGGFTQSGPGSSGELALLLRSGALPAKLTELQSRTVGAELGQDAIDASVVAGAVAAVAIVAFMVLAYGVFGVFACVALVANLILILGAMALIGATLTLPGIAGLILTLAIAVDANVLIYERMRDEEKLGRSPALAIEAGFSRAIVTILDANITTILAALILFQFGAGPVRGFAWTLSIGTVTSVFTAVFVTQILIAVWFRATRPKALPI